MPPSSPTSAERLGGDPVDPPFALASSGDPLLLEHPDQAIALAGRQGLRACLVHDRGQVARDDEECATHPEHTNQRPTDVEGILEVAPDEALDPRPCGEEDGGGIARVQAHHPGGGLFRRGDGPNEAMPQPEPRSSLLYPDGPHARANLPAGLDGRRTELAGPRETRVGVLPIAASG